MGELKNKMWILGIVAVVMITLTVLWQDSPDDDREDATAEAPIEAPSLRRDLEPMADERERPALRPGYQKTVLPKDPAARRLALIEFFPKTYLKCFLGDKPATVFFFGKPSNSDEVSTVGVLNLSKDATDFFVSGAAGPNYSLLPPKPDGEFQSYPLLAPPFPKDLKKHLKLAPDLDGSLLIHQQFPRRSKANIVKETRGEESFVCDEKRMQDLRTETIGMTHEEMFDYYEAARKEAQASREKERIAEAISVAKGYAEEQERMARKEAEGLKVLPGKRVIGSPKRATPATLSEKDIEALTALYNEDPKKFREAWDKRAAEIEAFEKAGRERSEKQRDLLRDLGQLSE